MSPIPQMPDTAEVVRATAAISMRYEDVAQDGRLMTIGMPHALTSLWRESVQAMPIWEARKVGIMPILAQMWARGTDERIHVGKPSHCEGAAMLAHTADKEGNVERILLDMHAKIYATRGSVLGPKPAEAGELVVAGEVYARHVFTRLFAKPGSRRVHKLEVPGGPAVPECQVDWIDEGAMLPAMPGCNWLDDEATASSYEPLFAPHHCDSNQHVNSLVYPRLFEDAAQQRFAESDAGSEKLSREVALSFRRPFFAGQRAQMQLRAFKMGEEIGCIGAFVGHGDKTHCSVSMRFK
ncbi:MAG: hypothetical protein GY811_30185 [Myxococcales bacterium]|nr:hypothetical protein [Myxococcales bacterium]